MEKINLLEECKDAKKIVISGHIRPDGDCVGSCMAMYLYLKKALADAEVVICLEQPADIFACIKDFDCIDSSFRVQAPDVFLALDCEKSRLGEAETLFDNAKKRINIDHHVSNMCGCGDVNFVVPGISSTAELVYELMDKDYMDVEIAKAVYIGIIHDTGIFKYSNTSPKTLRIAAELIEYGFDFPAIIDETFYEKTYVQNQLLGRALLEGTIFMYETGSQEYKVSLRSCKYVDVSKVASYFGGGGHVRAAGCSMNGNFYDVINNISAQIARQMEEYGEL